MTTASQTAPQPHITTTIATPVLSKADRILSVGKYALLLFLSFTWLFPLYWMVTTALKDDSQIRTVPPVLFPAPMYWENFVGGGSATTLTRLPLTRSFALPCPLSS